ncbi:MAG TPA: DUF2695 domain-containing protein [Longimicrobium sp.]|jgi:hypothetical protein|nr:DUF2695 domain-containing protein [Longimicrobium sp.]
MPSSDEKRRRKELKRNARQQERSRLEATMPLSQAALSGLFDYLDEALAEGCDHTLRLTRAYLGARGLDEDRIIPWLEEHGGGCDCEVLANVEEEFEFT